MKEKNATIGLWMIIVLALFGAWAMGFKKPPLQYVGGAIFIGGLVYPWVHTALERFLVRPQVIGASLALVAKKFLRLGPALVAYIPKYGSNIRRRKGPSAVTGAGGVGVPPWEEKKGIPDEKDRGEIITRPPVAFLGGFSDRDIIITQKLSKIQAARERKKEELETLEALEGAYVKILTAGLALRGKTRGIQEPASIMPKQPSTGEEAAAFWGLPVD